jgi:hypothetical protein
MCCECCLQCLVDSCWFYLFGPDRNDAMQKL